jgi:predicted AlkP superfamily pyrophosphatase or phosphodiesterase
MPDASASAAALLDRVEEDGYVFPDYDGYCFASVPETLLSLVSDEFDHRLPGDVFDGVDTDVSQVVVVLLDGLGWDQWQRDSNTAPLLDRFDRHGAVSPLTTVYPSETAAAITTFHSGQPPSQHGLLGWFQYIQEYDAVLQTLPFTTLDGDPATDVFEDADDGVLSDADSLWPRVDEAGVDAHLYQPSSFEPDTPGGVDHLYWNVVDAVAELRLDLDAAIAEAGDDAASPSYRYLYVPEIDAAAHSYGTDHARYRAQLRSVTEAVRAELLGQLSDEAAAETLLVLTADHGLINTDPATNVDLRETAVWDHVGDIQPVGSPRNVQFHVDDPDATATALREEFGDDVRTFTREEYLDRELFGPGTCETFETRAPDLVAVHREKGLLWEEETFVGMHGGLSREEMLVPFATGRVAALRE